MTTVLEVGLGARSYEVSIGPGVSLEAGPKIARLGFRRAAVAADETALLLHGERFLRGLAEAGLAASAVGVPSGEEAKSFAGLETLIDALLALDLDRGDLVVAFGGGVTGDLAGFAAAILKRGVAYCQVPTTLLAQVDSSVGGKTGIDTARGKNLVGAFHQPVLVLADTDLLATLPAREVACGYAEIVKIALACDRAFLAWLEAHGRDVLAREGGALEHAVRGSVALKAQIVAADEREAGDRALLNLGHTFGHALETLTGFSETLRHGEAVALGCALAFRFSARLGLCPWADAQRAEAALAAAGLPTRLADLAGPAPGAAAMIEAMRADKKSRAGAIALVLARGVGEAFLETHIDDAVLARFLREEGAAA